MPIAQAKGWEIYQQKNINNALLVTVGFGDGGGGVTREMLEMNRRMQYGIPGTPKTRLTTAEDALNRIKKNVSGKKIPKWFGELYLERHRGTYTSIGKNKKYNRRSEFLLQEVESLCVAGKVLAGPPYPKKELYQDWTTVLLNQFHDIIPGSSIGEVYEDSQKQYEELLIRNTQREQNLLGTLAHSCAQKGILVYNATGTRRDGLVKLGDKSFFVKDVPALGWKVIDPAAEPGQPGELLATVTHMENRFCAYRLNSASHYIL